MEKHIVTNSREFSSLREPWNELHTALHGTVYQSFDWLHAWWTTFGDLYRLRLLTVWDGPRLVAAFPCFVEKHDIKITTVSCLRMLGEHSVLGEYSPLVLPEYETPVMQLAAGFLASELNDQRCDFIDFHHFSPSLFLAGLLCQLKRRGIAVNYEERSLPRVVMQNPPDWKTYLGGLSYNQRGLLRRRRRALEKRGASFEVVTGPEDPGAFVDFVSLHTAVWQDKGERGFFNTRHRFEEFHRDVTDRLLQNGVARLYFCTHKGERIAGLLTYATHDLFSIYLSGRLPNHELARYSPGTVLMSVVFQDAIEQGYRMCDLLEGTNDYKFRLGGNISWYSRATLFRRGVQGTKGQFFLSTLRLRDAGRRFARQDRSSRRASHVSSYPAHQTRQYADAAHNDRS
jgi:CelD/BcsL family acetyltransferase involved in cellulose biosynthesis